ncbi:hypothetical protein ACVWWK_002568 [Bradyrhizobium sp. LB9.1b]
MRLIEAAASSQPPSRERISAAGRIKTVAEQMDLVGPASDMSAAGLDQRQPQAGRIDRQRRERARNSPVWRHNEGSSGMGELVVRGVVDRAQPEYTGQCLDVRCRCTQEIAVVRQVASRADLRGFHGQRLGRAVLGIETDDDEPEIPARLQSGIGKGVRYDRYRRSAERLASVIGENPDGGNIAEPALQR